MIVYKNYTQEKISEGFDLLVEGMNNWKMPIKTTIKAEDFQWASDACAYFTGSILEKQVETFEGDIVVYADGYYNTIGA